MPYVKLGKSLRPRKDSLKADLLERKKAEHLTNADMASSMGISPRTYSTLIAKHTDEWTLAEIRSAFQAVNVRILVKQDM